MIVTFPDQEPVVLVPVQDSEEKVTATRKAVTATKPERSRGKARARA
jgi:hypothetical protein